MAWSARAGSRRCCTGRWFCLYVAVDLVDDGGVGDIGYPVECAATVGTACGVLQVDALQALGPAHGCGGRSVVRGCIVVAPGGALAGVITVARVPLWGRGHDERA